MTRETQVPAIPAPSDSNVVQALQAIKNSLDVREGRLGDPLDQFVSLRELKALGLATDGSTTTTTVGGTGRLPVIGTGGGTGFGPDPYDETTDLTTPPAPTGLTATAGLTNVYLSWNGASYSNHSYTEVWRSETNSLGSAALVGTTIGSLYQDAVRENTTYYYWIRFVSMADVKGPYNATSGTAVTTGQDPTRLLQVLSGQITESQLFSTLGARINLIDAAANVSGSVNNRISAVQATVNARIDTVQAQVNDLINTPTYSGSETYLANELVVYNGSIYRALQTTTGNPPTNTTYWEKVGDYTSLGQAVAAHASQISTLNSGLSAEVSARQALATQVNDPTTGLAATRATLTNDYYTRTATDSAISAATSALTSSFNSTLTGYVTNATLTNSYYTKTATDSAIASSAATLTSNFNSTLSGYVTNAALTQDYYTKTATNSAISAATTGLVSTTTLNTTLGSYVTNATLTNQYYTKTAVDSAISNATLNLVSNTGLSNALAGYVQTGALANYVTNATLTNNYYTATDTNSAISSAVQNLVSTTALNSALAPYVTTSTLTTNYYTKTQADSAISSATTNLVSTTALSNTLASYPTTAVLTTNHYTKTQTDSAISSATSTLVSTTALNTALGNYTTTAGLTTNYYTKTQTDTAISSAATTLTSNFNNSLSAYATTASLTQNYYTKTQTDSAISSATNTLSSSFNNTLTGYATTAAVQQNYYAKASGQALEGQYTVKVDLNGYATGFGLASTVVNGTPSSSFIIRSDSFAIGSPSGPGISPTTPFIVQTAPTTINGESVPAGVYIDTAFIRNGTINSAQIVGLTASKITAGTITAAVDMQSPVVRSGNVAPGNSGFYLGAYGGSNQFYVGNGAAGLSGRSLQFDGTNATIRGGIYAYFGTIGSILIDANGVSSSNYVSGFSGFSLNQSGAAEFQNLTARGNIQASSLSTGVAMVQTANIVNGAITTAKIDDAQITSAKIGDAEVGTLKIAGNAITVPVFSGQFTDVQWFNSSYQTILSSSITISGLGSGEVAGIIVNCVASLYPADSVETTVTMGIFIGGVEVSNPALSMYYYGQSHAGTGFRYLGNGTHSIEIKLKSDAYKQMAAMTYSTTLAGKR